MLMKELSKFDEEGETNGETNVREYRKTSMNRSVAIFDEFVYKLAKMNSDPMEFWGEKPLIACNFLCKFWLI